MILKEPYARAACARVNPVSHTPRASDNLTLSGRLRCGRESSQGAEVAPQYSRKIYIRRSV